MKRSHKLLALGLVFGPIAPLAVVVYGRYREIEAEEKAQLEAANAPLKNGPTQHAVQSIA